MSEDLKTPGPKHRISLRDIQAAYFQLIEGAFGQTYSEMVGRGRSPEEAAEELSCIPENQAYCTKVMPDLFGSLAGFWDVMSSSVWTHIETLSCVKGMYGSSLLPQTDLASSCGLYLDTIVIPDPIVRIRVSCERSSARERAKLLLRHVLKLLRFKDLAIADVDPPILVIAPESFYMDVSYSKHIEDVGKEATIQHCGRIFGRQFSDWDDCEDFFGALPTPENLIREVRDSSLFLLNAEESGSPEEQIHSALTSMKDSFFWNVERLRHPGICVLQSIFGRMMQASDSIMRSARIGGTTLIDAATSWKYYSWRLAQEDSGNSGEDTLNRHIVHGLQHAARNDMRWLGNIPHSALIELRREGALDEIRSILGRGIEELVSANPEAFFRSADKLVENVHAAFDAHERAINELSSKRWKFARSIGMWTAMGTIELAAALTGNPLCGGAAFLGTQFMDVPRPKELIGDFADLRDQGRALARAPVGLLFQQRKRSSP